MHNKWEQVFEKKKNVRKNIVNKSSFGSAKNTPVGNYLPGYLFFFAIFFFFGKMIFENKFFEKTTTYKNIINSY